jgi:cytochrome P450
MTVAALQQVIPLNPLQQWRYFSQPRRMHDWLRLRYGDFAALHFQGRNFTAILTPEGARQVFTADPDGYDAFWKESFAGLNGERSLWVIMGEAHRRERQLFAPAVHANHFRAYGNTIRDIARENLEKWQPGQTVRAIDTTLAISLDIIMRLVFGVEDQRLMAEGREVLEAHRRTVHPLIVFFPALQRPWFPLWRRYARATKNMYAWVDRLLAARRARGGDASDVLGTLMEAHDEDGNLISDAHIRNELNSILGAGHETTATALAWALYELGRHPEVLAKLRAELASVGEEADTSVVIKLPYLAAVCNETVRLHPILAECARVPIAPLEILGRTIPAGQALVISIVGIHHNPAIYPEPDRFLPERFIERTYSIFEFLPFGGGHRRCLGAGLAEYSMRIALAEIAQHWEFESASVDRDIRHDIAMGPRRGVPLHILERRNQQKMVLPGGAELFEPESLNSQLVHGK